MHEFSKQLMRGLALLLIFLATACQQLDAHSTGAAPTDATRQLLIKFKPATVACNADAIARFSARVGVVLTYVRPLSGDACVVRQLPSATLNAAQGLQLLQQHSAVEWAEVDTVMKAS